MRGSWAIARTWAPPQDCPMAATCMHITDEERKAAIKEAMAQICRERDEYEAQKAAAKKAEEE